MVATVVSESEPKMNVYPVFSDGPAAENRELHWSCRFIWSGEKPFLQPRRRGFVMVCAENLVVRLVVVVVAHPEAVKFLGESFA